MARQNPLAITDGVTRGYIDCELSNEMIASILLATGTFGHDLTHINLLISDARIRHQLPIVPANVRISHYV